MTTEKETKVSGRCRRALAFSRTGAVMATEMHTGTTRAGWRGVVTYSLAMSLALPAGAGAQSHAPEFISLTSSRAIAKALEPILATPQAPVGVGDWSGVLALTPGTRVEVRGLTRKDRAGGRVVSTSGDSLTITSKNGDRTFNRSETTKVEKVNPRRNLWIALGAGSAVGAGIAVALATARTTTVCGRVNCVEFPAEPSTGDKTLLYAVTIGAATPFIYLARNVKVYER